MFWIVAVAILILGGLLTLLPLFRAKSGSVMLGLGLACLVPLAALWLYTYVGSPNALDVRAEPPPEAAASHQDAGSLDMQAAIESLKVRLAENPNDVEGWVLLSRSFKATQQMPEAVGALESALAADPDNAYVMAELAEARLFTSPRDQIDERVVPMLQRALALDPSLEKALWLLGITSAEAGNDEDAIGYWEELLTLIGPEEQVSQSIQSQINEAKSRLGMEVSTAPAAPAESSIEPGIPLQVSVGSNISASVPASAVLFVSVRNAAVPVGPPLGAMRVANPSLPLELRMTDRNSMMENMLISSVPEVTLKARLSMTGSVEARSGDWESAAIKVTQGAGETINLVLDHLVQ